MTQARKASKGFGTPPPLHRWMDAVLLLCVRLVQGVATTLGMIFKRERRDWHTASAHEDLPQAKSDIQLQETKPAVTLSQVALMVSSTQSVRPSNHERVITAHATTTLEADPLVRVPGEGRGPVLREAQTSIHRSALTRADRPRPHPACRRTRDTLDGIVRLTHA
jgi:hypothetical protein